MKSFEYGWRWLIMFWNQEKVTESVALPITDGIPAHFGCAGIYSICHSLSGRMYVGSSKDIRGRIYMHLGALGAKKHHSRLQNAWNKYGQGAFTIAVLERTLVENLVEREQFWIEHYDSYEKGFNARPKAESMRGVEWSKAQNEARGEAIFRRGAVRLCERN